MRGRPDPVPSTGQRANRAAHSVLTAPIMSTTVPMHSDNMIFQDVSKWALVSRLRAVLRRVPHHQRPMHAAQQNVLKPFHNRGLGHCIALDPVPQGLELQQRGV